MMRPLQRPHLRTCSMSLWHRAWMSVVLLAGAGTWAADPSTPAVFQVQAQVAVPGDRLHPVGFMNFCEPMGALKSHHNLIFKDASNEPPQQHAFGLVKQVEGGGATVRLDGMLMSRTPGAYNGVSARIYRIVDKAGQPLPLSPEKTYAGPYLDLSQADHVVCVGRRQVAAKDGYVVESAKKPFVAAYHFDPGPEIRQWDAIFLERNGAIADSADEPDDDGGKEEAWSTVEKDDPSKIMRVKHPGTLPAGVDLGQACLAFSPTDGEHGIKQVLFGGTGQAWYGQLYPGQKYHLEVWMCQKGLGNGGTVRFGCFKDIYPEMKTTFTVGETWQKFTFDFTCAAFPAAKAQPDGPAFWATGPGTLYIDNPRITAYDTPEDLAKPWSPVRQLVDEIVSSQPATGPKGFLRSWAAMTSRSMDQLLSWLPPCGGGFRRAETIPMHLTYCEATGTVPSNRMRPWITVNVFYTEDDWLHLIEYLAAPYDPATDTPQSKPWAFRRTQQRGHNRPWSEDFDRILFEFGNENWHNRVNLEWIGFGRAGMVHGEGFQYGLWGKYMFNHVMQHSPYWMSAGLDKKAIWNLGGNYNAALDSGGKPSGFGPESIRGGWPTCQMSSMALYVGPRWELGEKSEEKVSDEVLQKTLLAYETGVRGRVLATDAARQKMRELGMPYELVSYEGGPGGYGTKATEATIQLGHSLAMGIASADAWLDSYYHGWVGHCLYASNQGGPWSNHTMLGNGFRGTPAWQVLTTINRHLFGGDLMQVEATSVPHLRLPVLDKQGNPVKDKKTKQLATTEVQLARCVAFRQGDRWAVGVLGLKAAGSHNGVDLGDGSTPCTLQLPFQSAQKIELIAIQGAPGDHNEVELQVKPVTRPVPASALSGGKLVVDRASGSTVDGLPSCSFYVYVFSGVR